MQMDQSRVILLLLHLAFFGSSTVGIAAQTQEVNGTVTFVRSPGTCSEACYARGTCNEEIGGRCDCPKHLAGEDCVRNATASHIAAYGLPAWRASSTVMHCLNNCTRRGRCIMGACVCERGSFTADCSTSMNATTGKPVLLAGSGYTPREKRPRIFVYDIPQKYSAWHNPIRIDRALHWVFWERLLGSGALVADGDEADWYFIPAKLRSTSDGYRLMEAIQHVRQRWPWYDRLKGHRHFVIHTGDTGRGEVPVHVREATANLTWVHHWGLHEDFPTSGWKAAHRVGKDIVVPIFFGAVQGHGSVQMSGLHPRAPRLPRTQTLLFAGRICGDYSQPSPDAPWPHCATNRSHGYSQGVRQLVHFYHHNRTGYKLVTRNTKYTLDLLNFNWCLAPSGGGHGHRQTLVAFMGCLPLVISDSVMQPFEPEMDWSAFSMRVAHSEIPDLHNKLAAVDEEGLARKRDALRCAAQHLMFSTMSGAFMQEDGRWDAFEFIMEILRMQQTYPGLDPALYAQTDERYRYFVNCGEEDMETYGRKLREAQLAKYPNPMTLEGGSEVTWDYLYNREDGLSALLERYSKQKDEVLAKDPLPLCSLSNWDQHGVRCRASQKQIQTYPPGGAACEGYGKDLSRCPRLWT